MNAIKTVAFNEICRSVEQGYEIKCINTSHEEGQCTTQVFVSELAITFMHLVEFGAVLISYRRFRPRGDDVTIRALQRSF